MATTGYNTIPGNTRVRTQNNGLVRLDQLGGNTDLTGYYSKAEVDTKLLFKQHIITTTPGGAATVQIWDDAINAVRRLVAGSNVTLTLDENDNIIITASGGSGGVPSNIATFLTSNITLKVPTTCNLGLTVANTLIADEVHTDTIRANYFIGNGNTEVTLLGTTGAGIVAAADTLGLAAVRAYNRANQQGCTVETNSTVTDLCLKNVSASETYGFLEPLCLLGI